MPDFLHDKPLTVADLGNKDIFADFLINRAGWTVNRDDFIKTLKLLSDEGMQQIGALGFCWGAKLVVGAIGEDLGISAGCLIHPSALVPEDFEQVRAPILVIESRDEKDFSEEFEGVRRRFGKSVRDRYNDMHHGFAGARGDWSDEVQADRATYTTTGEKVQLGSISAYVTGSASSTRGIIINYDIFGYHANVLQLCDILGTAGFRVILPDLLDGKYLTEADLGKEGVFMEFARTRGSWAAVKGHYQTAYEYLQKNGCSKIGVIGFCWGGKMVVEALKEVEGLAGGAIVHPAMITDQDFGEIKAPLLALPSKDEPDYTEGFKKAKALAFGDKCEMVRFDDMFHGFCGARGDWSNETQAKRANDAIKLLAKFFNDVSTTASL
ncbi:hypothetical protein FBU59_004565 [Linderina macrospora]|uniref:Uncharacterized protein n=1 Tax=Linderina macrospora TaxID=4868 RepID=A0ACC1J529_9FUNG|nr:hypothetical protein FBU59_004565 [Linderina macrospora]